MVTLIGNVQFATLPDSPNGYKSIVSVDFKFDEDDKPVKPYFFNMDIPAQFIMFRFTDHETCDHEVVMEGNMPEIDKLVNAELKRRCVHEDQISGVLVNLPLQGKHVIEWDKLKK